MPIQDIAAYVPKAQPRDKTPEGYAVYCSYDALVPITEIIPNPRNPNQHPPEQIKLLGEIIKGSGWRQPITVSKRSGFIVKGHGRYEAAKLIGSSVVPVDYQDYGTGKAVFGECRKVPDYYKCFIPYDFLITVYETNTTLFRFTDEQYHILLYHELQHVGVEYNQDGEPCYSVRPHDVEEFRSVIEKHGIDWAINETFKRRSTLADGIYDTGEN